MSLRVAVPLLALAAAACHHAAAPAPVDNAVAREPDAARCTGPAPECLPRIDSIDATGAVHPAAELDGQVVILYFWTDWCSPCQHDIPVLASIARTRGVAIFGISAGGGSADETDAAARALGMTFPALPMTEALARELGVAAQVPTTFVYDRHGSRVADTVGMTDEAALTALLDRLLAQ